MLPAICHSHSTGSRRRSARYRCARTHVLYELRVGQHEEVVEDIVKAAVGDFRLADQPVHLLLDLVGPGDGLLELPFSFTETTPGNSLLKIKF